MTTIECFDGGDTVLGPGDLMAEGLALDEWVEWTPYGWGGDVVGVFDVCGDEVFGADAEVLDSEVGG